MSNQQLAKQLREVGAALEARKLSLSEAAYLADGLLQDAKNQEAFKGTLLERIVGRSPNIIRVARWEDDEIQKNIDLAYEIGDPDDLEAVQRQAIIEGCAKIAEQMKRGGDGEKKASKSTVHAAFYELVCQNKEEKNPDRRGKITTKEAFEYLKEELVPTDPEAAVYISKLTFHAFDKGLRPSRQGKNDTDREKEMGRATGGSVKRAHDLETRKQNEWA